jgi:hypothetical protein
VAARDARLMGRSSALERRTMIRRRYWRT